MARRRSGIAQARGFLYALARLLGDVQAVSKGPEAMAKRAARRAAGKLTGMYDIVFDLGRDPVTGKRKQKLAAKTVDGYANIVEKHLPPALGNIPLAKLQPLHL